MSSLLQEAGTELKRARWALGINGVLSIAFGVLILVWPGISLYSLTIVFGAYVMASGVIGLGSVLSGAVQAERGWLVLRSLLDIGFGLVVFFWTGMSALALLYVIAAWAITIGVITVGGAFWLPLSGGDSALVVLTGLGAILFGIVMFAMPGAGALVLLALIAAFALVQGVGELAVAIGGERVLKRQVRSAFGMPKTQASV